MDPKLIVALLPYAAVGTIFLLLGMKIGDWKLNRTLKRIKDRESDFSQRVLQGFTGALGNKDEDVKRLTDRINELAQRNHVLEVELTRWRERTSFFAWLFGRRHPSDVLLEARPPEGVDPRRQAATDPALPRQITTTAVSPSADTTMADQLKRNLLG